MFNGWSDLILPELHPLIVGTSPRFFNEQLHFSCTTILVPSVLVRMDMVSLAWEIRVLLILSFPLAFHSENSADAT